MKYLKKILSIIATIILFSFAFIATNRYMTRLLPKNSCITIETKNNNYYYIHHKSEIKNMEEFNHLQYKIDTTPKNEYIVFKDSNGNKIKVLNRDIKKLYYFILQK